MKSEAMVPLNRLLPQLKWMRLVNLLTLEGIVPLSWFAPKLNTVSFVKLPKKASEMVPLSWLPVRYK